MWVKSDLVALLKGAYKFYKTRLKIHLTYIQPFMLEFFVLFSDHWIETRKTNLLMHENGSMFITMISKVRHTGGWRVSW